eukprot:TRINITY_DN21480_c0_g1_i4.p1 TRINITY_DN21480_c0_g1~~TRINITY_DN21480_c0_g1_i4.p1  ORF type:complete len:331 (+),score=37.08 TRINITY_DN21480_c0_g1_i4:60-1052(+)
MSRVNVWREMVKTSFRPKYEFPINSSKNWFPGHMQRGLKEMQRKVTDVDCVIEVHDSRIPLSGRNTTFKETVSGARPHMLVLNKQDLVPKHNRKQIIEKIKDEDPMISDVIFTNGNHSHCAGVRSLIPKAIRLIEESNRFHRSGRPDKSIIIIGIPNVGKSTIINQLRNSYLSLGGKATSVGAKPGVTRAVQEKIRISNKPLIYLLDTPGISKPNVKNMHVGMKLAVCNTLNDLVIGESYICDYLLWYLNAHGHFDYVDHFKLEKPIDDSYTLLGKIALNAGYTSKRKIHGEEKILPDFDRAAMVFLKTFRSGKIGRIYLDEEQLIVPER